MPSRLPPVTGTTKVRPSPSSGFHRLHRYYEPLGLPLGTTPLRLRLIGAAFAQRGPPRRVSPVPHQAFLTCPLPYPGSVLRPSVLGRSLLPSPRHDRLGHSTLSGSYLTRLQSSRFRIGPASSLPHPEPYGPARAFDAPLRTEDLASTPEPATRRSALTAAGLAPAGLLQHRPHPHGRVRSGRTISSSYDVIIVPSTPARLGVHACAPAASHGEWTARVRSETSDSRRRVADA